MDRSTFLQVSAFAAIVEHGNFARAAAHLGVTPSALSQTMRALEERLGVRLLNRTTRSVAPTEAGERYAQALGPLLRGLDAAAASVKTNLAPQARLRINTSRTAAMNFLSPLLAPFIASNPGVEVEVVLDDHFVDIVRSGCDAGIRLGDALEKDMVAVRLSADISIAVVASPAYLAANGTPRSPADLRRHRCINWRLDTNGAIYRWEFTRRGHRIRTRVAGSLIVRDNQLAIRAAEAGLGIAYVLEVEAKASLANGSVIRVLADCSPVFTGFHLYYPHRNPLSVGLRAFVDFVHALRPRALSEASAGALSRRAARPNGTTIEAS